MCPASGTASGTSRRPSGQVDGFKQLVQGDVRVARTESVRAGAVNPKKAGSGLPPKLANPMCTDNVGP